HHALGANVGFPRGIQPFVDLQPDHREPEDEKRKSDENFQENRAACEGLRLAACDSREAIPGWHGQRTRCPWNQRTDSEYAAHATPLDRIAGLRCFSRNRHRYTIRCALNAISARRLRSLHWGRRESGGCSAP